MNALQKISLLLLVLLFGSPMLSRAQESEEEMRVDEIYDIIQSIITQADATLPADCDPYGFQFTIKVVSQEEGEIKEIFRPEIIKEMVYGMLSKHNFAKFSMDQEPYTYSTNRFLYIGVGLVPQNAKEEEFSLYYHSYTCFESINGVVKKYTIHIGAQFIIRKPDDGGIAGDVYYVTDQGNQVLLQDRPFLSDTREKKIKFRRLGPGSEEANSGEPDKESEGWKPFQGNQSNFTITSLTPGHYFPLVRINGCIQRYDDPDLNQEEETIIKTRGVFNWDNPTKDQKIVIPDRGTAVNITDKKIYTTYSTGNKVQGFILTPKKNPGEWRDSDYIEEGEVQVLRSSVKVWIEPYGWNATSRFPDDTMARDGYYEFEKIPSGVYLVYLDGQKENGKIVSVCNCDEEGRALEANMTYQQNLGTQGYEIHLDYQFRKGDESLDINAVWNNVVIAFGDEEVPPQQFSLSQNPMLDSLGNYLDIKGNILQPPFTILERRSHGILCNDIFLTRGAPAVFSLNKSGTVLSGFTAIPDFSEDGLYNSLEVIKYDHDSPVELVGENIKKGIYFTWQFAIKLQTPEGDEGPEISVEASEIFQGIEEQGDDPSMIFGGGIIDARAPEDVVEKIKRNEEFSFTKSFQGTTYTLKGILPKN